MSYNHAEQVIPDSPVADPLLSAKHAGFLREIDTHFAVRVAQLAGDTDPLVRLGLAVASRAPGAGHVCVELDRIAGLVRREGDGQPHAFAWPDPVAWAARLRGSAVVGSGNRAEQTPLVLDGMRLYLSRYWRYQERLVAALETRASVCRDDVDTTQLREGLTRLFGPVVSNEEPDFQRIAACVAVLRNLTIITGGPGTGKTTTVVRILALLLEQHRRVHADQSPLRIALAAPTGKAAARMVDAIRTSAETLQAEHAIVDLLPTSASTVHRLLGFDPRRPTRFRRNAEHPLDVDVLVVDEASMVDLALMTKLLDAVPADARVIILGDRHQLASVEAGAILGDVCGAETDMSAFSTDFSSRVSEITGLTLPPAGPDANRGIQDCIVRLTKSRRFTTASPIGRLARAIQQGDGEGAVGILTERHAGPESVSLLTVDQPPQQTHHPGSHIAAMREAIVEGYRPFLTADTPESKLRALDRFRVLCAHRTGAFGVGTLNHAIFEWLRSDGNIPQDMEMSSWYHSRPFIITQNDYALDVFNGDIGVIVLESGAPRAYLWASGGGVRSLSPARLPAHETVFAMTIHKSQGSEFDDVVLVLPQTPSPILTRELLYTGVSRARRTVTIVGTPPVIRVASSERVQRASGIRERLWGSDVTVHH